MLCPALNSNLHGYASSPQFTLGMLSLLHEHSAASASTQFFCGTSLLHELRWVSLEPLLAGNTAKMIGLTIIGNLELGNLLVQNGTTNRILRHYPTLNLTEE
jgi:hypothetical protein